MRKSLVVAMAEDRVIGKDNGLPWHIPADLRKFQLITLGKPIIMGRKTFESIGKPLRDRTNIVVTRKPDFAAPGIIVARCYEEALEVARQEFPRHSGVDEEIMVIGGEQIFALALQEADRIYLTRVETRVSGGDARFPEFNESEWHIGEKQVLFAGTQSTPRATYSIWDRVF